MTKAASQRNAWHRLRKNKGAMSGLAVIVLSVLVAVFAYLISPDDSPNANRIIVEIGGRKPGFTQTLLRIPREGGAVQQPLGERLFFGRREHYDYMPIESYEWRSDSVVVQRYVDEGVTERRSFAVTDLGPESSAIARKTFLLGTDKYGRDIVSRLIVGVRVSLAVGMVTVLLSVAIGILLGALAGYFPGKIDDTIMWFINVMWSIPTLLLVFAITLVLGKGFWQVFIAIGLTTWVSVARVVRGQVLAIRGLEYVEAARALGFSDARIIARHILPNVMGPVIVIAAANFASAIVIEAGLSFLGVGVQPPQPSWGLMIKENYNFIITNNPMLALAPGFAIMILVLAFNMLGNGLRDALQVKA